MYRKEILSLRGTGERIKGSPSPLKLHYKSLSRTKVILWFWPAYIICWCPCCCLLSHHKQSWQGGNSPDSFRTPLDVAYINSWHLSLEPECRDCALISFLLSPPQCTCVLPLISLVSSWWVSVNPLPVTLNNFFLSPYVHTNTLLHKLVPFGFIVNFFPRLLGVSGCPQVFGQVLGSSGRGFCKAPNCTMPPELQVRRTSRK